MNPRIHHGNRALLAAAAAVALTGIPAFAGTSGSAVTISMSGSTAMRNFTISPGFSLLTPGTSITLNSGPGGIPVTYAAAAGTLTSVQLAAGDFTSGITANPGPGDPAVTAANYAALRLEWHEQGSVEGVLELADSQVNDSLVSNAIYNPTSGNATYVNRNRFGGTGGTPIFPPATVGGHLLDVHPNDLLNRNSNAQDRVQMAISDVTTAQGFSRAGTGGYNLAPGSDGYGKGNPALAAAPNVNGVGIAGARQQLQDESILNMTTSTIDPATGSTYGPGPWNTAGVANTDNKTVAIQATGFAANPGTGLTHLNRTDAQWLQTTGRLQNGADFNVTTRDVGSGTRNVAALNVGIDPSFAAGEDDGGDGNSATGGTAQVSIGPGITFSNKTAGGSQLRPTVQNARMAIGHLSISDAIGSANNTVTRPLRMLDYRDDADDTANGSNATIEPGFADPASGTFTRLSAANIVNGSYVIYQNETYVTIKAPGASFAGDAAVQWAARTDAETGIKGDNAGHDVADVRGNILQGVNRFPASSVGNPGDALVQTSFILPQFMQVRKDRDGLHQSVANPGYDSALSGLFLGSPSLVAKFDVDDPATISSGSGSRYGDTTSAGTGSILITSRNYLFGDFNQNGMRDFAAVKSAQAAQAALAASGAGVDMLSGEANTSAVSGLPSPLGSMTGFDGTAGAKKGDLIVMGDYNADGRFDGRDLYALARGAALADNASTDQLTAASGAELADRLRRGVLRKNAALDWMSAHATVQQKLDATASAANDASGANAFRKEDVNRDGLISRADAQAVDHFVGRDYRSLDDQLSATVSAEDGTVVDGRDINGAALAESPRPIDLIDVELNDTGNIDRTDFAIVRAALGDALLDGDTNFDGRVDVIDLGLLATDWQQPAQRWSAGDFNLDGSVDVIDLGLLATNWQLSSGSPSLSGTIADAWVSLGLPQSQVPEPTEAALLLLVPVLARRRRRPVRC